MSWYIAAILLAAGQPAIGQEASPAEALRKQLRQRHLDFMRREIVVEKYWTEDVNPHAEINQRQFNDMKFGGGIRFTAPKNIPKPYKQPHRVRSTLLIQGKQTTLKLDKELERLINPTYGWKTASGAISSNASGADLTYHPPPMNRLFEKQSTPASMLLFKRYAIEMCLGFGHLRAIKSISELKTKGNRTTIKGSMNVMERASAFEMELDQDLIVRRLDVAVPANDGGFNRYVSESTGTIRTKGAPPVAKQGRCRRIVEPVGGEKRTIKDDTYRLVSISQRLSRAKYEKAIKLNIPADATKTRW